MVYPDAAGGERPPAPQEHSAVRITVAYVT